MEENMNRVQHLAVNFWENFLQKIVLLYNELDVVYNWGVIKIYPETNNTIYVI